MQVEREKVSIETPGGAMPAQMARPANGGPLPAVIVVQEAFGLNHHIEAVAARLAAEGYATLAPDLFHRGGAGRTAGYDDLPKALTLMGELNVPGIVEDMGAAIGFLEKRASVRADRIGVTGFCMGGRVTYLTA